MARHGQVESRRPKPTTPRSGPSFSGTVLAITCVFWGGAYALGGPATSPTFALMSAVMPMRIWGTLLALGGLFVLMRAATLGYALAATITIAWAMFSGITLVAGTATGVGLPLYIGFAVLLGRCLYREREARRAVAIAGPGHGRTA